MTPLNSFLESIHSAWIDEMVERHPKPKPELCVPKKISPSEFPHLSPDPNIQSWCLNVVHLESQAVSVWIGLSPKCETKLKIKHAKMFDLIFARAKNDFIRRKIDPQIQEKLKTEFNSSKEAQNSIQGISKMICFPIKLDDQSSYLILGI